MKYLRLFQTVAEKEAATLDYPNVNYTIENDSLEIIAEDPTPAFGGLTVKYNIIDPTQEVALFNGGGGSSTSSSTSGSGSGSSKSGGGALPTTMIVDGNPETVVNTWRFETAGEHIVQYTFADNIVPAGFLNGSVATATEAIIGDDITAIAAGGAFANCSSLTSVTIGNSVTTIGEMAFNYCKGLTTVTIGDSVTSIGSTAFNGCSSLASVSLGSGVTSIGNSVFQGCSGLTSMTVEATTPPSLGRDVFLGRNANLVIYVPASAVDEYKTSTSTGWNEYASLIQAIQ